VNMCFKTAKELLACIELDISRRVVRCNQTVTELQYLCKSDKSYICKFAAHNLKSPLQFTFQLFDDHAGYSAFY